MPLTNLSKLFSKEHTVNYYDNLLEHHDTIIRAVRNTNQKKVAEAIHMTEAKFSAVYRILLAYADVKAK